MIGKVVKNNTDTNSYWYYNGTEWVDSLIDISTKQDISEKGHANGYVPLNNVVKIASQYLDIVNDLITGGATRLLSAEQGKILKNEIDSINLLLSSDDLNLDTLQEIVDTISELEATFEHILVNDLITGGTTKALTAEMGKELLNRINGVQTNLNSASLILENKLDKSPNDNKIYAQRNGVNEEIVIGNNGLEIIDETPSTQFVGVNTTAIVKSYDLGSLIGKKVLDYTFLFQKRDSEGVGYYTTLVYLEYTNANNSIGSLILGTIYTNSYHSAVSRIVTFDPILGKVRFFHIYNNHAIYTGSISNNGSYNQHEYDFDFNVTNCKLKVKITSAYNTTGSSPFQYYGEIKLK